ncbi:MAG TPA: uridine diphosphate-N-acetylglucosamine-binding protein YvcK [Tetrasphaera sp.]|uniref:Putative gluconeogenesis factor n=1 Tax=Nostocoides vanveenii TaxID=330835 RepID=A0ABN2KBN5_9MICO|nr:uridine diphosphate-N-acetylglucosamine-binding protein YvcK [Tetrasphaera sp.]HNQ05720.1 uridine diphosphate-N-acetylglucosamine-binding protein YvcK [Tetrasphaera sp.]
MNAPVVVALGGGHGLAASLTALRLVCDRITAVVTVADNGGSSGRLREEFGVLPPGDLRMALAALCDDTQWGHQWRDVLQHRFSGDGPLGGHALGNLLIVALWDLDPEPVHGLDLVGRLLNAHGRVLPMAAVPLEITAQVAMDPERPGNLVAVVGQQQVARTAGQVQSVALHPSDPPAHAGTLAALMEADWIVLGPGSWFTSVLPHLLVPALKQALQDSPARKMLTLNLEMQTKETLGYSAVRHIDSLRMHAPGLRFDVVLADPSIVEDEDELRAAVASLGAALLVTPVSSPRTPGAHDPLRLAAAYRDIFGGHEV